jgi:hypothetical protein
MGEKDDFLSRKIMKKNKNSLYFVLLKTINCVCRAEIIEAIKNKSSD